ncbi:sterol desaturase family protein [Winogradskyella sp. 3972H.M.0a.05]|uniref:sterol desaturase family protein n=1 Tax=Winogradskyella sp. 3972H.M.0a.05 TaxID=2950277 RepID=UPI003397C4FA
MEELIQNMEDNIGLVVLIIFTFSIGLAIVEFCYELYKKKINKWRLGEMWASFSVFIVAQLVEKLSVVGFATGFYFLAKFIPWDIPVNIWTTIGCIIFVDFLYYLGHVAEHKIRIFWSYHSIHHSSPIFNYTTALRVPFIDSFIAWIFYIPAVLVGFHPYVVLLSILLMLTYQFWLHTEIIGKLGWFEKIFVTPSQHRVHHGSDRIYLDKNYGAIFCIWDRMFGTFQEEQHRPTYGLTKQINTINPIKVHFIEYVNIFKDLRKAKSFKDAWGYLVKPPGWKPKTKDILP